MGNFSPHPAHYCSAEEAGDNLLLFFLRHAAGDWGDLDQEDMLANAAALKEGSRLLSAYRLKDGTKIWLITEATDDDGHQAATTALLPSEY